MSINSKIYKSIKVKVDFGTAASRNAEAAEMEEENKEGGVEGGDVITGLSHLSGGQKTVVVVSLIFAVLKLEPAPFYILDEFDHALDSQYRSSIASLIAELSSRSQFLITTFKPELIRAAQAKLFEVRFHGKKSAIKEITKDQALSIVRAAPDDVIKAESEDDDRVEAVASN